MSWITTVMEILMLMSFCIDESSLKDMSSKIDEVMKNNAAYVNYKLNKLLMTWLKSKDLNGNDASLNQLFLKLSSIL